MMQCQSCGAEVKFLHGGNCRSCRDLRARARKGDAKAIATLSELLGTSDEDSVRGPTLSELAERVEVTTETTVPGVDQRLGVVTGQCALGMNIFRDFTAELRDVVGGRSGAYQKAIKEAKDMCIAEMKQEAHRLGADAVIAMDLDFNEITGGGGLFGGRGMIMVVATGTAVTWEARESSD